MDNLNHEALADTAHSYHLDYVQFIDFANSILDATPNRAPGELIYIMAYLSPNGLNHITLLGATVFPNMDSIDVFLEAASEFIEETQAFTTQIEPIIELVTGNMTFNVRPVEISPTLSLVHTGLVGLAELYGGVLVEPAHSKTGYFPHITQFEIIDSDSVALDSAVFSIHPGGRVNVPHAVNFAMAHFKTNL